MRFTKNSSVCKILGFIQPHSGVLGDIERFIQLILGTEKINKPITIAGIIKVHLKCDCSEGSTVNGIREPILYSLALDKPSAHKILKEARIKLLKKGKKICLISYNILFGK